MRLCVFCGILLFVLSGCDGLQTTKINAEEVFQEEWNSIALNDVDTYPTFDSCNHLSDKKALLTCFQETIVATIQNRFVKELVVIQEPVHDTVWVHLVVDKQGKVCIDSLQFSSSVKESVPLLNLWLHDGIQNLPKTYPGIKRGIPVKTQFKLPVVLQVD